MQGCRYVAMLWVSCLALSCGPTHHDLPVAASGNSGHLDGTSGTSDSAGTSTTSGGGTDARGGTNASGGTDARAGTNAGGGMPGGGGTIEDGGGAPGISGPEAIDLATILDSYRSFAPQTPEPVNVSGYIFGLCRLPTLPEEEFAASIHGDERYLQDWANALAVQGIATRGAPEFPPGSVIVKEKYAGPRAIDPDLVALGIMIKRAAGSAPERGDWDYAYYEPALGMLQTAEQSEYCANCHAAAAETDFVFVDGLGR